MISTIDVIDSKYRLFSSIAIETSSRCNRKCPFCPNAYTDRPEEYMSNDMFIAIVDELAELKYSGRVELYMYNEPLLDSRLRRLIMRVRDKLPRACIMLNTNGDYITSPDTVDGLIDAGLNQLGINVYSNARREYDLLKMTSHLPSTGSLYSNIGSHKAVVKVIPKYGITPENTKLPGVDHISNRAGNIPDFAPPIDNPLQKVCTRPFRFLNINWRGQGMLCCNDYHVTANVGRFAIGTFSLLDIWNDVVFNLYRLHLQAKNRNLPLCDVCDFAGGYYPHMLHHVTFGDDMDSQLLGLFDNIDVLHEIADAIEDGEELP